MNQAEIKIFCDRYLQDIGEIGYYCRHISELFTSDSKYADDEFIYPHYLVCYYPDGCYDDNAEDFPWISLKVHALSGGVEQLFRM